MIFALSFIAVQSVARKIFVPNYKNDSTFLCNNVTINHEVIQTLLFESRSLLLLILTNWFEFPK